MVNTLSPNFHSYSAAATKPRSWQDLSYRFYPHFHPYVAELVKRLIEQSVPGLQAADTEYSTPVKLSNETPAKLSNGKPVTLAADEMIILPDGTLITLADSKLFCVTKDNKLWVRDSLLSEVDWQPIGSANDVVAMTVSDGKLFFVTKDNKLWARDPLLSEVSWQPIGSANDVVAMTAINGKLFFVTKDNKLWARDPVLSEVDWQPIGHAIDVVAMAAINGTPVRLSGNRLVKLLDGTLVTLYVNALVTLPSFTFAKRLDGTPVILSNDALVTLPDGKPRPALYEEIFSKRGYYPSKLVDTSHPPVKDLDFTSNGAYSVYNWELFYHAPLTIAIHLSKNQRFEEAQRWFHYMFDPTDDSDGPTPERFWKVKPFQYTDVEMIEEILVNLSTGANDKLKQDTIYSIGAWKNAPFRPHVVARFRQSAYMFKTVMAYLDNLIAWGDTLFRQDTGESINEATQLYVLAANILGPLPQAVPKKGSVRPQTYANLRADLNVFGNALRELEADIPSDHTAHPNDPADLDRFSTLRSLGNALYFCVPRNDNLLSYWDSVADRLFKIRNSLNIQGIFRQLPLFEPPIDPAMLARAAAAGLDVGAIVTGLNQPLPLVRFQLLVQKANEICQEVKSLGNNLLSAIEKEDNEALAVLRAKHERVILELAETVKYQQWQEAIKNKEGLEKSFSNAVQRYTYYERLLGKESNKIKVTEIDALDTDGLEKMKFHMSEPEVTLRDITIDIAEDISGEGGGKKMNTQEVEEMSKLKDARSEQDTASTYEKIGAALGLIPGFGARFEPLGAGGTISFGGSNLAASMTLTSSLHKSSADRSTYEAGRAAKISSYARREQEWAFQSNLAAGEITQLYKQLRAAQIREAIAELELKNHRQQMKHAKEIERFLNEEGTEKTGKKTNQAFYTWMKREAKGLYGQCFQFAFDIARKAERALQHELGDPNLSFLQFGYLTGKEGLLAGEKLYLDIKRMEMAYHDLNQREYELTKHVSLLQVNPQALLQLRAIGRCTVFLPEDLFDMDCSGHYFRRIKSVAVSIPCVVGPYTSINCTLTLLKSVIRKSPLLTDGSYARDGADDNRFSDHFGSMQTIVTSTGQNDSALFETNLRDERYLPFEGSGVVSEWQLELPADVRQFDYDTIADVILHLRYTAREGGGLLRNGAVANLKARIDDAQAVGSVRLFSVRDEFPSEWAKFKNFGKAPSAADLTLSLREEHFPYWSNGRLEAIKWVNVFTKSAKDSREIAGPTTPNGSAEVVTHKIIPETKEKKEEKEIVNKLTNIDLPKPPDKFTLTFNLHFDKNSMENIWLAVAWGKGD